MINCIAIDDEPLALKQMSSYIEKTPFLNLVKLCESAIEAISVVQNNTIDLMFVDINMPDLSGMDFVKSLDKGPKIIFTTAYSEYAIDGFKVDAIDYLLKPIGYAEFLRAAQKAHELIKLKSVGEPSELNINDDFLFIKSDYKLLRVNLKDILYIEGMREYVRIHLVNQKPLMTLLSMKALEEQLPGNRFMRVHRSFIVSLKMVTTIERQRIVFNDVYIPISDQYKANFQAFVDKNFI